MRDKISQFDFAKLRKIIYSDDKSRKRTADKILYMDRNTSYPWIKPV